MARSRNALAPVAAWEGAAEELRGWRSDPRRHAELRLNETLARKRVKPGDLISKLDVSKDSGDIDAERFGTVLREMGVETSPEELNDIFMCLDKDGSGGLSYKEMQSMLRSLKEKGEQTKAHDKQRSAEVERQRTVAAEAFAVVTTVLEEEAQRNAEAEAAAAAVAEAEKKAKEEAEAVAAA